MSRYKIIKKIGGGGMGTVYKAEDTRLRRTVVLKYLHPELLSDERSKKRFLREAQAASALDHPNICNIYEIDETDDGRLYISMAFYDGEVLTNHLAGGPLSLRESFEIAFSIARGLASAHDAGIIHRDIKPANIVITRDGYVKIVDFGLAKLTGRSRVTQSGTTLGTVAYMSPEQARSEDVDHRADIWSLGVLCYQMLTGKLPFRGEIDQAMVYSILNEDYIPAREVNSKIPEACSTLVDRCLNKDPEKRYQSVNELLADMLKIATKMGWASSIATRTVIPVGRYKRKRRRSRLVNTIVAAVIMLLIAVTVYTWREAHKVEVSPYTTEIRLAVMPFENLTGPESDALVDGLNEITSHIMELMSRSHHSMWVVPHDYVVFAKVPNLSDVGDAFGVNRIITGDVHRFADKYRLSLKYRDSGSLEPIRTAVIDYLPGTASGLLESLPGKLAEIVDPAYEAAGQFAAFRSSKHETGRQYIEALGLLQRHRSPPNLDNAIRELESIAAADSGFAPGRCALGTAYWRKYEQTDNKSFIEPARKNLTAANRLNPQLLRPLVFKAYIEHKLGNADEAIAANLAILALDPGNTGASRGLARVYRDEKRLDEAEAVLKNAIRRHLDYFRCYQELGVFYYRTGNVERAIQYFQKTLELAHNDSYTINTLGAVYYNTGQWTEARRLFERSFKLWPSCQSCSNIGLMLYYEGQFEQSASYYKYALEYCDSSDYLVWGNWAASLYWVDNQRDEALELFRKAVGLAEGKLRGTPDDSDVIKRLVNYYTFLDDEQKAMALVEYAKRFSDDNTDIMYFIGVAYEKFGQRELALRFLGRALRRGYPKAIILGTPMLKELVKDPIFTQMIEEEAEPAESPAGASLH